MTGHHKSARYAAPSKNRTCRVVADMFDGLPAGFERPGEGRDAGAGGPRITDLVLSCFPQAARRPACPDVMAQAASRIRKVSTSRLRLSIMLRS